MRWKYSSNPSPVSMFARGDLAGVVLDGAERISPRSAVLRRVITVSRHVTVPVGHAAGISVAGIYEFGEAAQRSSGSRWGRIVFSRRIYIPGCRRWPHMIERPSRFDCVMLVLVANEDDAHKARIAGLVKRPINPQRPR